VNKRRINLNRNIMSEKEKKKWKGHVPKGNSVFKTHLEGRIQGKKTVGLPRSVMLNWLMDKTTNRRYIEL